MKNKYSTLALAILSASSMSLIAKEVETNFLPFNITIGSEFIGDNVSSQNINNIIRPSVLIPLTTNENGLTHFDLAYMTRDFDKHEINVGLGFRNLTANKNIILGAFVHYDLRHQISNFYHQITIGLELFTSNKDFRLNFYLPFNNDAVDIGNEKDLKIDFQAKNLVLESNSGQKYLVPMFGTDFSFSYTPNFNQKLELTPSLFYFYGKKDDNLKLKSNHLYGLSCNFKFAVNKSAQVMFEPSWDNKKGFKLNVGMDVKVHLGSDSKLSKLNKKFYQLTMRDRDLVLSDQKSQTVSKVTARNNKEGDFIAVANSQDNSIKFYKYENDKYTLVYDSKNQSPNSKSVLDSIVTNKNIFSNPRVNVILAHDVRGTTKFFDINKEQSNEKYHDNHGDIVAKTSNEGIVNAIIVSQFEQDSSSTQSESLSTHLDISSSNATNPKFLRLLEKMNETNGNLSRQLHDKNNEKDRLQAKIRDLKAENRDLEVKNKKTSILLSSHQAYLQARVRQEIKDISQRTAQAPASGKTAVAEITTVEDAEDALAKPSTTSGETAVAVITTVEDAQAALVKPSGLTTVQGGNAFEGATSHEDVTSHVEDLEPIFAPIQTRQEDLSKRTDTQSNSYKVEKAIMDVLLEIAQNNNDLDLNKIIDVSKIANRVFRTNVNAGAYVNEKLVSIMKKVDEIVKLLVQQSGDLDTLGITITNGKLPSTNDSAKDNLKKLFAKLVDTLSKLVGTLKLANKIK